MLMKKLCIYCVAILYVVTGTQFASAQGVSLKAKVGGGSSCYRGDYGEIKFNTEVASTTGTTSTTKTSTEKIASDTDPINSFYVGIAANIGLGNKFSIQPELLYVAQGGGHTIKTSAEVITIGRRFSDTTYTSSKTAYTYNIGYLRVPLLAKYYLIGEVGNGLSLSLGPDIGFKVSEGGTQKIGELDKEHLPNSHFEQEILKIGEKGLPELGEDGKPVVEKVESLVQDFDLGLIVGVDYDFSLGLSLGLRYNVGFTNVFSTDIPNYKDATYKNSMLSLSVAYCLCGARKKGDDSGTSNDQ